MNKRNVLNCIEDNQPINRSAIAQMVGLSIPAVMSITDELLEHGMIQSIGRIGSGVGKHPEQFTICGSIFGMSEWTSEESIRVLLLPGRMGKCW